MALAYRGHFLMRNPHDGQWVKYILSLYLREPMLEMLKEDPTHVAVAFDTKEPTRRHEEFPEYKAQRDHAETWQQLPYIEKL